MGEYLIGKLKERNLLTIISDCRDCALKGYFSDDEDELKFARSVIHCRDFDWFKKERDKIYHEYDAFCEDIEAVLPSIERIDDNVVRLRTLLPLFEKALLLDGKRRSFDMAYNEEGSIANYFSAELKKVVPWDDAYFCLLSISPTKSFEMKMFEDFLGFMKVLPESLDYSAFRETPEFSYLLNEYARGSVETFERRFSFFKNYHGIEDKVLEQMSEKLCEQKRKKDDALAFLKNNVSESQFEEIIRLMSINNQLTAFNSVEDPHRHSGLDGLEDYFLRDLISRTLYDMGLLATDKITDYPQRYVLKIMKDEVDKK